MYLIDKKNRESLVRRQAAILREELKKLFKKLLEDRNIQHFTVLSESFRKEYFVFHTHYECIIKVLQEEHKVSFSFDVDIREIGSKTLEERFTSKLSKFLLSPTFSSQALFDNVRKRILQWKTGMRNEALFDNFLGKLEQLDRIDRAYKTGNYDDRKKGIDFVVSFYTKPYWELVEVKFNLKSSTYFIEKHKAKHPTIGTFVFKSNIDLADEKSKRILTNRFLRFLLQSAQSEQVVHM